MNNSTKAVTQRFDKKLKEVSKPKGAFIIMSIEGIAALESFFATELEAAYTQGYNAGYEDGLADETQVRRETLRDMAERVDSLCMYLMQIQKRIEAHPDEESDEWNLVESIKEKVDEEFFEAIAALKGKE